ncbi:TRANSMEMBRANE TRANSPORT PROTEIN [hydrothermal vent metagenome]|uniref:TRANSMEMBRANE TRANSPORT PROTEIN n=1 Tax=hydrothermal vent metagenome TaxID=652676 RepID=A0A1W1EDJ9_9ZZZZ
MKLERFSRIGFILAAAGSAVGLGNIWKFPYMVGENGGGAFVMVYLLTVLVIGFSIMIAEMLIGYLGRGDTVTSFENLAPNHKKLWKLAGFQAITALLIMSFYSVVIGWIFNYVVISAISLPSTFEEAKTVFTTMVGSDIYTQLFYHTLAFLSITYVVNRGIKGGIEKLNLILMPALMFIFIGMFFYATTLDGFSHAISFMFTADWSKINATVVLSAIGQAFFTLSLGMGAIMTYSASLPEKSNLLKSSLWVVFLDTSVAIVAGIVLFTFVFHNGAEASQGPGLVFMSLPVAFHGLGTIGTYIAVLFFIALAFAGFTSAVSLLEPMVQFVIGRFNWSRLKASIAMGSAFYLIGIVALLSNTSQFGEALTFGGKNVFDHLDFFTSAIMLPLAGLIMAIFIGYFVEKSKIEAVLKQHLGFTFEIWYFSLRFIAPIALVLVALSSMKII